METITLLAIQTGLLFLISFYLLYRLRNKIKNIQSEIIDHSINLNSLNLGLDQKTGILREALLQSLEKDSQHIDKRFTQVYQEIGKIQNVLYRPLYKEGETVYFREHFLEPEKKGKIVEVINKCGEMPEYKISVGKSTIEIPQQVITAWE